MPRASTIPASRCSRVLPVTSLSALGLAAERLRRGGRCRVKNEVELGSERAQSEGKIHLAGDADNGGQARSGVRFAHFDQRAGQLIIVGVRDLAHQALGRRAGNGPRVTHALGRRWEQGGELGNDHLLGDLRKFKLAERAIGGQAQDLGFLAGLAPKQDRQALEKRGLGRIGCSPRP